MYARALGFNIYIDRGDTYTYIYVCTYRNMKSAAGIAALYKHPNG